MFYELSGFVNRKLMPNAISDVGAQGTKPYRIVPYKWVDTIAQNCENRFKRVATGLMNEIQHVDVADRLNYVIKNCKEKQVLSLFERRIPTEKEKQQMRVVNAQTGPKQPKGSMDLEKFEREGSHGMYLKNYMTLLEDPITEDQMIRQWILAKFTSDAAKRALRDRAMSSRSKPY